MKEKAGKKCSLINIETFLLMSLGAYNSVAPKTLLPSSSPRLGRTTLERPVLFCRVLEPLARTRAVIAKRIPLQLSGPAGVTDAGCNHLDRKG